jgi:hypothetical protein
VTCGYQGCPGSHVDVAIDDIPSSCQAASGFSSQARGGGGMTWIIDHPWITPAAPCVRLQPSNHSPAYSVHYESKNLEATAYNIRASELVHRSTQGIQAQGPVIRGGGRE